MGIKNYQEQLNREEHSCEMTPIFDMKQPKVSRSLCVKTYINFWDS